MPRRDPATGGHPTPRCGVRADKVGGALINEQLDAVGIAHQEPAPRQAAGQAFYNVSPFTLRDPTSTRSDASPSLREVAA